MLSALLHKNKIERIIIADNAYNCIGLMTGKDFRKKTKQFPHASKDKEGRLLVAAATGKLVAMALNALKI